MKKSIILLSAALFVISTGVASADTIFTKGSPMFTNIFGPRSTYDYTHNTGSGDGSAQAVNATIKTWSKDNEDKDVVIKTTESNYVPAGSLGGGEGYSYEKGEDGYIYGYTEGEQGVNESKTIYTDGIGRLHFFGRNNRFRD